MKKIAIALSVVALSMGFTACDNYELPNPPAQTNPAVAPFDTDNINVVATPVEDGAQPVVLDLLKYNDANETVPVGQLELTEWPADYNLGLTMYISKSADMADAKAIPATVDENSTVMVAPDLFQAAYREITADPRQAKVYANFGATAGIGESTDSYYIGGPDYRFGALTLDVKPFPADYVIDDVYYLVSGDNKWKMNHSELSPYDDPSFSYVVTITADEAAAGFKWTIVGEASGKSYGCIEGNKLEEGVEGSTTLSGPVMFSADMKTLEISIFNAYEFMYTPGDANGWSQVDSNILTTTDYMNYSGWVNVASMFKYCATTDWSVCWGTTAEEGKLMAGGADNNITVATPGAYYTKMSTINLTYEVIAIESCGVIGDATEGAWDAQTNLTQDPQNPLKWSGKIKFAGTGEWKFRFNDNWDINLGGAIGNLTQGGANMPTPGDGEFTVTLDLSVYPYSCTVE